MVRQLWPAATLAEYRLALHAPPRYVAAVLDESDGLSGQFTIGPLTEVAAQHHTWDELCDELDRSRPVVVVCRSGARSARAVAILTKAGFPNVANLAGGMLRWRVEGGAVSGGQV